MTTSFGSTAWAARTHGRPSGGERWLELARGLRALTGARLHHLGRRLGLARGARWAAHDAALAMREVELPRTPLALAALARLDHAPPWLVAHSLRSYLWGALLAVRDGTAFDQELAFTAVALHDLGLTCVGPEPCFAHRGAELARATCLAAGASARRAAEVADAICQHLNVSPTGTAEAQLVRAGAGYDVVGDRFFDLPRALRREILTRSPRDGFAEHLQAALAAEAGRQPQTRIAFLCSAMRFPALIARADRWFARELAAPAGALP